MTDEKKPNPDPTEEMRKAVEDRVKEENEKHPIPPKDNGNDKPDSRLIRQCVYANESGDGDLFAHLFRNKFRWNNQAERWLEFMGHTWGVDVMQNVLSCAEDVVELLLEEAVKVSAQINEAADCGNKAQQKEFELLREAIYKRVSRLRTVRGREAMLKMARTCKRGPLAIRGDELDLHPWLFGCKNGVLDLRIGEIRDGRPDEYISRASPVAWEGLHAPAPIWETWLREVFRNDEELIAFLQRVFGYAMTGLNREHIFLVLWGQGRNGKGTFIETIADVLGDMASPIQSELLLDQGFSKTAGSPSPEIAALKGLRLAFASETDEGRKFSSSRVKWLTGGETLTGRYPYDKYDITFKPTHTLILMTNNRPNAPADDFAFWERLFLSSFTLSFVDREPQAPNERRARKGIVDELKKEAPGILAWLARGCLQYQERGLDPPQFVIDEKNKYRRDQDIMADFMEECCEKDESARTRSSELYDRFCDWFEKFVSKRVMKQKRFGTIMGKRFERVKIAGIVYYIGIKLKDKDKEPSEE